MIRRFLTMLLLMGLALSAGFAAAAEAGKTFLVLGVIASATPGNGVALVKSMNSGETFAARIGQIIARGVSIEQISRDYVVLRIDGRSERVKVGEQVDTSLATADSGVVDAAGTGIERSGSVVRISSELRQHVVSTELAKVMMQAASVPYYQNGELQGFQLWDIDAGSIYQRAGFLDGDVVTSINGQRLSDVGLAIRVLQQMKNESNADITFLRNGVEQKVQIVIQ